MFKVWFGRDKEAAINMDVIFLHRREDSWFDDDLVKQMIKDIDNTDVISSRSLLSPVLGNISPEDLSGGVKGLILLYKIPDLYVDCKVFGENCCKWLCKISELHDIHVSMSGYDLSFKDCSINGWCENDNSYFNSQKDWILKMCKYVGDLNNER